MPHSLSRSRDIRLDFFRGLAMLIILIAHIPGNPWTLWIPARFGFSDATEMFVFCSGMASALAFGARFDRDGFAPATRRVAIRLVQVYLAHIGLFLAVAFLMVGLVMLGWTGKDYVGALNLYPFFASDEAWQVAENRWALLTLTYVPNYFDILPMYCVVLALLPVVMGLAGISRWLALALVAGLWLGAQSGLLWLPAEPWTSREWFFNPFGWQLLFFTGFALVMGWMPAPRFSWGLTVVAVLIVVVSVPAAYYRLHESVAWAATMRETVMPLIGKTDFGLLRYAHFLALAYLAYHLAGEGGRRLLRVWAPIREAVLAIGRQALIVFFASMILAQVIGFAFDVAGRSSLVVALGNGIGMMVLLATARVASWVKRRLRNRSTPPQTVPAAA